MDCSDMSKSHLNQCIENHIIHSRIEVYYSTTSNLQAIKIIVVNKGLTKSKTKYQLNLL